MKAETKKSLWNLNFKSNLTFRGIYSHLGSECGSCSTLTVITSFVWAFAFQVVTRQGDGSMLRVFPFL